MKDDTMGNQQATATDMAWLAGLYDGEGSFHIARNGKSKYQVRITLTNCDSILIAHAVGVMNKMGVEPWINSYNPKNPRSRTAYTVVLSSMANAKKLILGLKPYLVGRAGQASLILKFVESRERYNGMDRGINAPYTDEEDHLVDELRTINQRGASEIRCQAPTIG